MQTLTAITALMTRSPFYLLLAGFCLFLSIPARRIYRSGMMWLWIMLLGMAAMGLNLVLLEAWPVRMPLSLVLGLIVWASASFMGWKMAGCIF